MTKSFRIIMGNALTVTMADPFFLVLHLALLVLSGLLTALPGFTDPEEHRQLLRDQNLALFFMVAALAVVFAMIRTVTDDFRRGAGAVLLSRPIGNCGLVLGKWAGIVAAAAILTVSAAITCLWQAEAGGDGDHLNGASLATYYGAIAAAIVIAGIRHYLVRGSFPRAANWILLACLAIGLLIRLGVGNADQFDWRALSGVLLLFLALAAFAAILLPVALLLDSAMVLAVGAGVFLFGLLSNHLIRSFFADGFAGQVLRSFSPNWQLYWVADRLAEQKTVPLEYVLACLVQTAGIVALFAGLAALILQKMEVRSDG